MNDYLFKIFDRLWNYKQTINPNLVISDFSFSSNNNGGLWNASLNVILTNKIDLKIKDIIKVYIGQKIIFQWIINEIQTTIENWWTFLNLSLLWFFSLFSQVIYKNWTKTEFSKNDSPKNIIKDIIESVNNYYDFFIVDDWNFENFKANLNLDFKNETCQKALKKCLDLTNFNFVVDENLHCHFFETPKNTHFLTIWKDVESLEYSETSDDLTNLIILKYKNWVKNYNNLQSQNFFGVYEKFFDKSADVVNEESADIFANSFFKKNAGLKKEIKVNVNNNYLLLNEINVGDFVTISNSDLIIKNQKILKLKKFKNKCEIYLQKNTQLGEILFNKN